MRTLLKAAILISSAVLVLVSNGLAGAEKMYVTDELWLTVRSDPRIGSESLKVIRSGQDLEVITTQGDWSRVLLPGGTRGWVLQKYLTAAMTAERKLKLLQNKYAALETEVVALRRENSRLKNQHAELSADLSQKIGRVEELKTSYASLQAESADFLELKEELKTTRAQLIEQRTEAERLADALSEIESQRIIHWFLTGAGVLLLGFVIGFSAKRQRRRSLLS